MQPSDKRSPGASFGGRRVLRFSLQTMLLLTTLIAVWLGLLCKRAREQQVAVDRIVTESREKKEVLMLLRLG